MCNIYLYIYKCISIYSYVFDLICILIILQYGILFALIYKNYPICIYVSFKIEYTLYNIHFKYIYMKTIF